MLWTLFTLGLRVMRSRLHAKEHMGLHEPLTDLRALVQQRLSCSAEDMPHQNGSASLEQRLVLAAQQCVAEFLLDVS